VDRFGPGRVLGGLLAASAVPHLVFTNLSRASFVTLALLFVLFMTTTSGRMIPTMVLITARVPATLRGRYLAVNTAVSDGASGLATWISGMILTRTSDGRLLGFARAGVAAVAVSALALTLLWSLRRRPASEDDVGVLRTPEGAA
jgi:MFS transporter, DHA1 family, inner membrane transport protein